MTSPDTKPPRRKTKAAILRNQHRKTAGYIYRVTGGTQ